MPDTIKAIAARAKALSEDPTFLDVMQRIRERQIAVFLDASSTPEAREEAHVLIRALEAITNQLKSDEDDWAFEQKKGQHRGSD
ncbi:hypothetical protein [Paracoccus sulfuroxidans]|uniref:Uncharacterized protein n=1 Tax=Paracoccus sulfuroxidans TaxID=384678 RepID=A0A562NLW6_9RHOB|nr:hypothetical protein [Paracoccus sulfuroxidans]TWI32736.1 hypothetical protein IQ24_02611 [Paracoccus sulfuroxidans]